MGPPPVPVLKRPPEKGVGNSSLEKNIGRVYYKWLDGIFLKKCLKVFGNFLETFVKGNKAQCQRCCKYQNSLKLTQKKIDGKIAHKVHPAEFIRHNDSPITLTSILALKANFLSPFSKTLPHGSPTRRRKSLCNSGCSRNFYEGQACFTVWLHKLWHLQTHLQLKKMHHFFPADFKEN